MTFEYSNSNLTVTVTVTVTDNALTVAIANNTRLANNVRLTDGRRTLAITGEGMGARNVLSDAVCYAASLNNAAGNRTFYAEWDA